jgi:hypothetical protein
VGAELKRKWEKECEKLHKWDVQKGKKEHKHMHMDLNIQNVAGTKSNCHKKIQNFPMLSEQLFLISQGWSLLSTRWQSNHMPDSEMVPVESLVSSPLPGQSGAV